MELRRLRECFLLLAAGWLLMIAACGPQPETVTGLVIGVESASPVEIQSFRLRTADQRELSFTVKGKVGMTSGHLREHMQAGLPVEVTFVSEADRLRAITVDDGH